MPRCRAWDARKQVAVFPAGAALINKAAKSGSTPIIHVFEARSGLSTT